jgi:hypothetical protein
MRSFTISALSNIRVIKSRRMRWVGHVVCEKVIQNVCQLLVVKLEGKRPLR